MSLTLTYDPVLSRIRIAPGAPVTIANPGLEVNATGWFGSGGTLTRSTAQAHSGVASGLLTPDGVTATAQGGLSVSGSPAATVGKVYRAAVWVKVPTGYGTVAAVISWINSSNGIISSSVGSTTAIPANVWTQLTVSGTAPALTVLASGRVQMTGTPPGTALLYADDLELTRLLASSATYAKVERSTNGVTWTTVRGGGAVPVTNGMFTLDDYEFPAGVPVTYRVTAFNVSDVQTDQETGAITADLGTVWLKVIAKPFLNRPVTVVDWSRVARSARNGVFPIVGRQNPVAVTDVRAGRQFDLVVMTPTLDEGEEFDTILSGGDPVYLHTPAGCPVPGPLYAVVGDTEEERRSTRGPRRYFTLPMTEVAAPGPDVVGATSTCATVLATYATCQAVLDAHPTCQSLLELIGSPTDVVVP